MFFFTIASKLILQHNPTRTKATICDTKVISEDISFSERTVQSTNALDNLDFTVK